MIDAQRRTEGVDGCLVKVKNIETERDYPPDKDGAEQETSLWQVSEGGHFRWTVNDELCEVIPHTGSLDAPSSPFMPEFMHGDSEAFVTKGEVAVKVTNFLGGSSCRIHLYNVADGQEIWVKEATRENPVVTLDPSAAREAYVSDPSCDIQVTP